MTQKWSIFDHAFVVISDGSTTEADKIDWRFFRVRTIQSIDKDILKIILRKYDVLLEIDDEYHCCPNNIGA